MADLTAGRIAGGAKEKSAARSPDIARPPSAAWSRGGAWRQLKSLWPILVVVLIVLIAMLAFWQVFNDPEANTNSDKVTTGFSVTLAVILALFPAVLCTVQNTSLQRQQNELKSLEDSPAAETTLYKTAVKIIGADDRDAFIDNDYIIPILAYFVITFVGFLAIFLGFGRPHFFSMPTVLLGGLQDSGPGHADAYLIYQRQTFVVFAMAFIGSYAYALGRILDRINNNDLYPISLYYYAARVIIASAVAMVLRHTIQVLGVGPFSDSLGTYLNPWLILMGFVVGFTPDLFIISLSRKAFQALKVWGTRADPKDGVLPASLPLLMIDDLTREKIDRLNELGIDSAQVLARQNPFLLLPRLPFELSLLNDWIAQAQLYVLVKEDRLKALREIFINDIVDLYIRLKNPDSNAAVCATLGRDPKEAGALLQQLEADDDFTRLLQLTQALKVPVVAVP